MPHVIFSPKEGVKFLITTDVCPNLRQVFVTQTHDETHFCCQVKDPSDSRYKYLDFINIFEGKTDPPIYRFRAYNNETYELRSYGEGLKSILDHLNFHHKELNWYLLSSDHQLDQHVNP